MRAATAAGFLFLSAATFAAPEVLIVQRLSTAEGVFNVPLGQKLVEELDLEGRVSPILWSMTDPVFRAYVDDGKLPRFVENPDDRTIRDYAGRLKVAYVLVVEAVAQDSQVIPQANLYAGNRSRPMWSMVREDNRGRPRLVVIENGQVDEEKTQAIREKYASVLGEGTLNAMTVLVDGQPDWDSTASTLARTWTRILAEGPFSQLEPMRRTFTPEPDPGLTFAGTGGPATPPDTAVALEQARILTADGQMDQAILILRDAIDASPFALDVRLAMGGLMMRRGHAEIAATECERGTKMVETPGPLWALAADAWVQAGQVDKALNAANEAQARGIATPELLQTLGDVWLLKADIGKALKFYGQAIDHAQTPRSLIGRAIARAIDGDTTGALADLDAAQGEGTLDLDLYQRCMTVLDAEIVRTIELLKNIPKGVRMLNGPDMLPSATALQARTSAIVELMAKMRVPERHTESHSLRDLACKLLSQSSVEVLAYVRTKDEDASLEAAISLGEAIKMVPKIGELFLFERKYGQRASTG